MPAAAPNKRPRSATPVTKRKAHLTCDLQNFIEDFDTQLDKVRKVYRLHPTCTEFNEEHTVALFYNLGFLTQTVLTQGSEDIYQLFMRALTPDTQTGSESTFGPGPTPILTLRNLLCLALSIYGCFQNWMENDNHE